MPDFLSSEHKVCTLYIAAQNSIAKITVAINVHGKVILEKVYSMLAGSVSLISRGSMTNWSREQP